MKFYFIKKIFICFIFLLIDNNALGKDLSTYFVVGASLSAGFNADEWYGFTPLSSLLLKKCSDIEFIDLTAANKPFSVIHLLSMMKNGFNVASQQLEDAKKFRLENKVKKSCIGAIGLDLFFWHVQNPKAISSEYQSRYPKCKNHGYAWAKNILKQHGIKSHNHYFREKKDDFSSILLGQRIEGLCLLIHEFQAQYRYAVIATIPRINIRLWLFDFPAPPKKQMDFINDLIRCFARGRQYELIDIENRFYQPFPIPQKPHVTRDQILSSDGIHLNVLGMKYLSKELVNILSLRKSG